MSFFRHNNKHHDHHDHHHDHQRQEPPPQTYPPQSSYPLQPAYPQQSAYPQQPAYPLQPAYPQQSAYPPQSSYPSQSPYQPQPAYPPATQCPAAACAGEIIQNSTVRIFTKAEENYSLSVREGNVVLVPTNPRDEYQHWYKDFRWANKVKDEEGLPAFALINKATGLAIKHSLGPTHPVRLIPFNPDYMDESVLWTESHDTGEGYRCIRMVNNIRLNFDAFHGDKDHGGVHDGTTIVLWEWAKGKNQRWKIVPYY